MNQILQILKEGNQRFIAGESDPSQNESLSKLQELAKVGQSPMAAVLCCSDSRVPVEIIFDQGIGDLFVIRVAGNIVTPSVVGSLELATELFGVKFILVMGHTQCGAIQGALGSAKELSQDVEGIFKSVRAHVHGAKSGKEVEVNVQGSIRELLEKSTLIQSQIKRNQVEIAGAVFELETGQVRFL